MNTFFTQFKKEAEEIRMTSFERSAMRLRLEGAMRDVGRPTPSPYFSYVAPRLMAPVAFVLILAVIGGGTAYAAEGAVPGDLLYPIKVSVTEPLRGSLAFSDEAKASWHAEAAVRRVQEAETLAARGTFTSEAGAELEENLDTHVERAQAIVATIEEKDPVLAASISARLASSLGAHGSVVSRLGSGSNDTTKRESGRFAERVSARERTLARAPNTERDPGSTLAVRTSAKMEASAAPVALGTSNDDLAVAIELEGNASTTLAAAEVELGLVKATLAATTTTEIKNKILQVRSRIKNSQNKRAAGNTGSATRDATHALRDAATLQAFLEAQGKFHDSILPRVLNADIETGGMSESTKGKNERADEEESGGEATHAPEIPSIPLRF